MELIEKVFEIWAIVGKTIAGLLGLLLFLLPLIKRKHFSGWFFGVSVGLGLTLLMPAISFLWKLFLLYLTAH